MNFSENSHSLKMVRYVVFGQIRCSRTREALAKLGRLGGKDLFVFESVNDAQKQKLYRQYGVRSIPIIFDTWTSVDRPLGGCDELLEHLASPRRG
jgi:hypothetical protein